MNKLSNQIAIAIICIILGFMLSVQLKTVEAYKNTSKNPRIDELAVQVNSLTAEKEKLLAANVELSQKLQNIRNENAAMDDLREELIKANMNAGFLSLEGPGIILTLNDSVQPAGGSGAANPNTLLVHDYDLLQILNEIKASGAEAISVNNERVIATTEVRCAGTTILINWKKIAPPFVIKATGDPKLLESGLNIKNGYLDSLRFSGIQVDLQISDKVDIPAYQGAFNFVYSAPVEAERVAN